MEALFREAQKEGRDLYIRFGDLPEGGRSRDYEHGTTLDGMSVYRAQAVTDTRTPLESADDWRWYDGPVFCRPVAPNSAYYDGIAPGLSDRPAYLVTGTKIGNGPEGEPIITDVEIVREVSQYQGLWS